MLEIIVMYNFHELFRDSTQPAWNIQNLLALIQNIDKQNQHALYQFSYPNYQSTPWSQNYFAFL